MDLPKKYWAGYQEHTYQPDDYNHYLGPYIEDGQYKLAKLAVADPSNREQFLSEIRQWSNTDPAYIDEIPNEPSTGYCVISYDNNSAHIMSPYGFIIRITPSNLINIIKHTTNLNGLILGSCVIAFDNNQPVILTINSDLYHQLTNRKES